MHFKMCVKASIKFVVNWVLNENRYRLNGNKRGSNCNKWVLMMYWINIKNSIEYVINHLLNDNFSIKCVLKQVNWALNGNKYRLNGKK